MNRWVPVVAIGLAVLVCAVVTWMLVALTVMASVGVYALADSGTSAETGQGSARLTVSRAATATTAPPAFRTPTPVPAHEDAAVALTATPQIDPNVTEGAPASTLPPPVNFPKLPDLTDREPLRTTASFAVYAADPGDPLLLDLGERWAPELEQLLADGAGRVGQGVNSSPVSVVFARRYDARCPARGLASPLADIPFISVYVDETTSDVQIRAVLAHEIGHHLTVHDDFVGDGVITEGIASWAAEEHMLAWLGITSWDDAVRDYLASGEYVSITDDSSLSPRGDEDCLERRDRVYTIRTAFVAWLVDRHGLETVLRMPGREVGQTSNQGSEGDEGDYSDARDNGDGRDEGSAPTIVVPDYEAVTGLEIGQLEELWLQELRRRDR